MIKKALAFSVGAFGGSGESEGTGGPGRFGGSGESEGAGGPGRFGGPVNQKVPKVLVISQARPLQRLRAETVLLPECPDQWTAPLTIWHPLIMPITVQQSWSGSSHRADKPLSQRALLSLTCKA